MAQRTGLRTITALAKKICQLIVTFSVPLYALVPADKHVYIDALNTACADFVGQVNTASILGDEDA